MCFLFIWEQTATCATYSINWLVFITDMKSVYCAVRTGSLTKAVCASWLMSNHAIHCYVCYRYALVSLCLKSVLKHTCFIWTPAIRTIRINVSKDRASRSQWPLACSDCEFQTRRRHGCLCFQVEVSATGWSLVQRSPTDCGVSLLVIYKHQEYGGPDPRWAAVSYGGGGQKGSEDPWLFFEAIKRGPASKTWIKV